jgi:hypothetical protein
MNDRFVINCSVDDLRYDIRQTDDPIKKTLLKKFLDIKMNQLRSANDDPSLDDLSENSLFEESNDETDNANNDANNDTNNDANKQNKKMLAAKKELDNIMKQQMESLNELDKLAKIKAYAAMIDENRKDKDQQELINKRGKAEGKWQNKDIYDPRYIKFQKEDVMNNKLMERLNSEIDFRSDDPRKTQIEKPFDDDLDGTDVTDEFARYEPTADEEIKYSPKRRYKLGQKRPLLHH